MKFEIDTWNLLSYNTLNKMNDLYRHISHVSWCFTYTCENGIRHQLIKAPQAATTDLLLILSPPPHPWTMNCSEGSHEYSQGFVSNTGVVFYVPIIDETTISSHLTTISSTISPFADERTKAAPLWLFVQQPPALQIGTLPTDLTRQWFNRP